MNSASSMSSTCGDPHPPAHRSRGPRRFPVPDRRAKEHAVIKAIGEMHLSGRPVLVGTASVRGIGAARALSLAAGPASRPQRPPGCRRGSHRRQRAARRRDHLDQDGRARHRHRVGEGVAELGGLHVIGTNRHESRRIDHQLRGRAGRQGDPGSSQFFEPGRRPIDPYGIAVGAWTRTEWSGSSVVEGQNFEIRQMLWKSTACWRISGGRSMRAAAKYLLEGAEPALLLALDDLWADRLADVKELREGIHWRSWGGREPFYEFVRDAEQMPGMPCPTGASRIR